MITINMNYRGAYIHVEGNGPEEVEGQFKRAIDLVDKATAGFSVPDDAPPEAAGLPAWKCHKVVWAGKILDIETYGDDPGQTGAYRIKIDDDSGMGVIVRPAPAWLERYRGSQEDFGYFVVYEDGYTSWSPSDAFENGYTRIE